MNSSEIFAVIEQIANTPGKNDKTALVASYIEEEAFHRTMVYAYNPFKTYGVRQFLEVDEVGSGQFDDATWQLLDDLIERRLTGNAALDSIKGEMARLEPDSRELLRRIILKDLRAGFSDSTINKTRKGTIPSFPYMRCSLPKDTDFDKWDWERGILSQEKADGMFVNVAMMDTGVFMFSRQGTPLPSKGFTGLLGELHERFVVGQQLHGELLVKKENQVLAREIGNGMLNKVIKGGDWPEGCYPILQLWDAVPLKHIESGHYDTPYRVRLRSLYDALRATPGMYVSLIETRLVYSLKEAYAHYKEKLLEGKEGTVIKKPTMIWRDHTSKDQIKLKLNAPCELKVVGFVPGSGKNASTFGSLLCQSACGQLEVAVGTGIDDKLRLEIHNSRDEWLESIITVTSNGILYSPDTSKKLHSLFLPVFAEQRLDKSEADDVTRIETQFENAVNMVGEAA